MNTFMSNHDIVSAAEKIACPSSDSDLFESQLSFWIFVRSLMKSGGYNAVKKRLLFVTEEVAEALSRSSIQELTKLCSQEFSTIKPSLSDESILGILNKTSPSKNETESKAILQIISSKKFESANAYA